MKNVLMLALGLISFSGYFKTHAQVINGDFQTGSLGCYAIDSWTKSTTPNPPEKTITGNNRWMDMTPCRSFGNGSWITQNIGTIPGQVYAIQMDLGAWSGWQQHDCGIDLFINGTPLNTGSSRLFNNNFSTTSNPNWQTVTSNTFVATSCTTNIRLQGNGANPLYPNAQQPAPGPGIMGLDNIKLIAIDNGFFTINSTQGDGCNEYCFSVSYTPNGEPPYPIVGMTGINWYVGTQLEGSGSTFCRRFPKNMPQVVMAVFQATMSCGASVTQSVTATITASDDCPCDFPDKIGITTVQKNCTDYEVKLTMPVNYGSVFTNWTIDNSLVNGGLTELITTLSPGTHTICGQAMGGIKDDALNLCCAKMCTTITVPGIDTINRVISHCAALPQGPYYDPCSDCSGYFEFFSEGNLVYTSSSGCPPIYLKSGDELRCYSEINGIRCLRKLIKFELTIVPGVTELLPEETLQLCTTPSVNFSLDCTFPYTRYTINGDNGYSVNGNTTGTPINFPLGIGIYTILCIDPVNCAYKSKVVHVVVNGDYFQECYVTLESCEQFSLSPLDAHYFMNQFECPECKQTVLNATRVGPWQHTSFFLNPSTNGERTVIREYYDDVNCKRCIVHYRFINVLNTEPQNIVTMHTGTNNACVTIYDMDLPACLQNKPLKIFHSNNFSNTVDANGTTGIELCCINSDTATPYYIYSEDDPCCYVAIKLICEGPHIIERAAPINNTSNEPDRHSVNNLEKIENGFRLVPNPTSAVFRIESGGRYDRYDKVEIIDINGKTLISLDNHKVNSSIDAGRLTKGTYVVKIRTELGVVNLKLILTGE